MRLFASVLGCFFLITTVFGKSAYESSFAYLQVSNEKTGANGRFCVNYQQFRSKPIVKTPEEAEALGLRYWASQDKLSICETSNVTSFKGDVVPFKYRIDDDDPCARKHLNSSLAKILNVEIDYLTKRSASAGLTVVDRGRNFTGKWSDYLFSEFYDPDVRADQSLPLFYVYRDVFKNKILSLGSVEQLKLRFYRPPSLPVDPSMLIIWFMAMFCVIVGGVSASRNYHKLSKMLNNQSEPSPETADGDTSQSQVQLQGDDQQEKPAAEFGGGDLCHNIVGVGLLMILVVGILLLGFFFRYIMVTLFNVVLVIAGTFALRCCTMDLLSFIFEFEDWELNSSPNDLLKKCLPIRRDIKCLSKKPKLVSSIVLLLSLGICVFWFFNRSNPHAFILLDGINIAVCIYVLKGMYFPNLKWLAIILVCMFVYDIFMVFGTPFLTSSGCSVMVEVAAGNDCSKSDKKGYPVAPVNMAIPEKMPVLFQVPRLNDPMISCVDLSVEMEYHPVMLGLGDVIVPGYLIGFCFTADLVFKSKIGYGIIATIGYGLGLIITFVSLLLSETAQPALIYLVPSSLLPVIAIAFCRGQLRLLWTGDHNKTLRDIVRVNETSDNEV
ncbi:hypothetical protein L596_008384 [Steinernema carpocapsae]|uniref:SSD domain-containing protein n=1 Tax=Steinernema carpocapsae TaxID=34508 RepID=A0A4U5PCG3_STECR|nr:hypothetical protein L596_008384 [Steinernema carpocapsae]